MITQQFLEKDYAFFKQQAKSLIRAHRYMDAIDAIKTAGSIAQNYCLYYADMDIEQMIHEIASTTVNKGETPYEAVPGRVLFYDSFSRDNVMLTTQYINALTNLNMEYMYLTLNPASEVRKQKFFQQLNERNNVEICMPDTVLPVEDSINFIVNAITLYRPEKVLIHTRAEDIVGLLPWYLFTEITRYYVEVSDHSYWPGTKAIDYCVCFRNYGYSNAIKYRDLKPEQILILPYCPALGEYPYVGIPESIAGSIKLFSGGRVTKILDQADTFLNLVKRTLEAYPNTEFYFAGGGLIDGAARFAHIRKFIKKNGLENRFHLLGQRKDILPVTEHMDIFINTFPFGGGLMVQIAAMCHLPVVILAKDGLCASIEEFLFADSWNNPRITFFSDHEIDTELHNLIEDPVYRNERGTLVKASIVSPDTFANNLLQLLQTNHSSITPILHDGDYEIRRQTNIQMENLVLHRYYGILLRSKILREKKPLKYIAAAASFVVKSDKGYLINTVKKYVKK